MSTTVDAATEIRSFDIEFPEEQIDDLHRRIAATRLPSKELVEDRSQGVQLATLQELARYWATEYDFGRVEARLNALPQFTTEIDGVDIHFIHVRSRHENALPLIMTHGWPGSVIELLETIGPLTDPTAYGGTPDDAFHLVLPSMPGYGFSSEPSELGWDASRVARAWAELMHRLGYTRYVAQGGDVGALVTDLMGRQAVEGLVGYHLNLLTAVLAIGDQLPRESDQERAAAEALATFKQDGFAYFLEMATRPQTIGYSLLDSPVALAAWLLDHDTDSYYKISRAFVDGEPVGNLTRDNILDNITVYWLTGTAASAARSYWEDARALAAALASGQPPPPVSVPVGFTTFPGEIWASPRSWVEAVYPGLAYFNEVDRGGHFAAWEEPELFSTELRAAFSRSLRDEVTWRSGSTPSHSAAPEPIERRRVQEGEMSVTTEKPGAPPRSGRSRCTSRKRRSSTSAGASRRRAGPTRRRSPIDPGRPAGEAPPARRVLGNRLRLAQGRGDAQRAAAVHHGDRRTGHPVRAHPLAARATPCRLLMTHGWPGSIIELLKVIEPLTDPTAHGGRAEDAFHLVLPTMPGYGFSGNPTDDRLEPGPDGERVPRADAPARVPAVRLPGRRLGRDHLGAAGGAGAEGLLGIHVNMPGTVPPDVLRHLRNFDPAPAELSDSRADRLRPAAALLPRRLRLRGDDEPEPADDRLRPGGLAGRDGGLLLRQVRGVDRHRRRAREGRSRTTRCSTRSRSTG